MNALFDTGRFREGTGKGQGEKTLRNQYGDPRFLEQVLKCSAGRRALLGLDAQVPVVENHVSIHLSTEERERHILALLAEMAGRINGDGHGHVLPAPSDIIDVEGTPA